MEGDCLLTAVLVEDEEIIGKGAVLLGEFEGHSVFDFGEEEGEDIHFLVVFGVTLLYKQIVCQTHPARPWGTNFFHFFWPGARNFGGRAFIYPPTGITRKSVRQRRQVGATHRP